MKKSEELLKEATETDNDFVAMGLLNRSLREGRAERWEDYLPKLLKKGYDIACDGNSKYTIDTDDKYGIVDYFPKANKLLIRKQNKWIKPGFTWIKTNL